MKQRLLLVDDDEVFLRPLHRTLELAGYEVLPVQSAEEALDTLKAGTWTSSSRTGACPDWTAWVWCDTSRPSMPTSPSW